MPIEKIQSQTTTHHVCGGDTLRLTDIYGLSQPFAALLGPRCFPLRDGEPRGGRSALMRSATALPCPLRSGVAALSRPDPQPMPPRRSRAAFWRVIHKNRGRIIG